MKKRGERRGRGRGVELMVLVVVRGGVNDISRKRESAVRCLKKDFIGILLQEEKDD